METAYAQALWNLIERGMTPKKAVEGLLGSLKRTGRLALMPRVARAFARIAARNGARDAVVLSIARETDERSAKRAVKAVLDELGVAANELEVKIDDSLIGGWRLEGRERLMDASWKKHLVSLYNRATQ
jgi:F0F1-type ATP synthase delta subunit